MDLRQLSSRVTSPHMRLNSVCPKPTAEGLPKYQSTFSSVDSSPVANTLLELDEMSIRLDDFFFFFPANFSDSFFRASRTESTRDFKAAESRLARFNRLSCH